MGTFINMAGPSLLLLHSGSAFSKNQFLGHTLQLNTHFGYDRSQSYWSRSPVVMCSAKKEEPLVLRVVVSGITELLRVFNKDRSQLSPERATETTIVPDDLVEALRSDYARSYFLTGEFTDGLYAKDCYFADPTVQFTGRDLYKRNLKLLVPFYEDPLLILDGIEKVVNGDLQYIQAFWRLRVYLKLPWKPFIAVDGSTKYDLDADFKIVKHVESWSVSGEEAIGQLFKASDRAFWRTSRIGAR